MSELCPCGSGRAYEDCCGPAIAGVKPAATAEALMRSRYSAYVKGAIDYIIDTCTEDEHNKTDREETRKWAEESEWQGLEILSTSKGGLTDQEGVVEFVAKYRQNGHAESHHEIASFKKVKGRWLYYTGRMKTDTVVRESPKVGRNDPCPCGSGKKYKQCCGKGK
jgi:SEC-C motif-containing protein